MSRSVGWLSDAPVGVGLCAAIKRRRQLGADNSGAERRPPTQLHHLHSAGPAHRLPPARAHTAAVEHAAAAADSLTQRLRDTRLLSGLPHCQDPSIRKES
ncbi:uncharacterized protein V6R79_006999 [Siganus canaliculatus]